MHLLKSSRHQVSNSSRFLAIDAHSLAGSYVGPEVDCWSLGACLFTMLTNRFPFEASDMTVVRHKIITGAWKPPANFSAILTDFLDRMLELNPLKRAAIRYRTTFSLLSQSSTQSLNNALYHLIEI